MASAWRNSWGRSWGNSWGSIATVSSLGSVGFSYTDDDYRKFREQINDLEAAGRISRAEAERARLEFDTDVLRAFHPEPAPEPEPEKPATSILPPRLPSPAVLQAFAAAERRQAELAKQEEEELMMLLLAA